MKLLATCLLFFLLAMPAGVEQKAPETSAQSGKQKAAEEAADSVMRRFYETLDFGVIYEEMYVSEPLKRREVQTAIGNNLLVRNTLRIPPKIDFAAMERAYIAERNFDFLISAWNFTDDRDPDDKELELQFEKYYMPIIAPANRPILTPEQLDSVFTANSKRLNEIFRKHVVVKNFDTDLYRKRLASFKESRSPELAFIRSVAGRQDVYVVQRERLHLYFVEENGKLRMLSVTSRVQD